MIYILSECDYGLHLVKRFFEVAMKGLPEQRYYIRIVIASFLAQINTRFFHLSQINLFIYVNIVS